MKRHAKLLLSKTKKPAVQIGKRITSVYGMLFAVIFAGVGTYVIMSSFAATGTTANLWIDADGGTCTYSATPAAYNSASACASMQAAVAASSSSTTTMVRMVAGTYSSTQTITSSKTQTTKVTIIGEQSNGANAVTVSGLTPKGNWIEIQNVNVNSGLDIENTGVATPNNVTFRDIDWNGGWWLSNCCDNIAQYGGRIHGVSAASAPAAIMAQGLTSSTPISNITLDGVEIDHMTHTVAGSHFEAIRTQGWSSGLTIRNSYFHDNGVNSSQIFISSFTGGTSHTPSAVTIEGNYFDVPVSGAGDTPAYYDVNGNMQGLACPDLTIRNNTDKGSLIGNLIGSSFWSCATGSGGNVKVIGNIAPHSAGVCEAAYSYNLFINSSSAKCGTGDKTVASTSAAGLTGDGFHISSSSAAIDAGGSSCPAADRDGDTRPQGGSCDAGADEFASGGGTDTTPPDTTITSSPAASTTATTASFGFSASEAGSTFECKLDAASYAGCTSPQSYAGLAVGSHTFSVRATDASNNTDQSPATYAWAVTATGSAPANTAAPAISGTLRVSSALTAGQGSWNNAPTSYTYQWQRCDAAGANCANIATATSPTFTLTCADYKKTLKLVVTASNASGSASAASAASTAVQKPTVPRKGDFNDDCFVDSTDVSLFVAHWRLDAALYPAYDVAGAGAGNPPDGQIGDWDLNALVSSYGYKG